MLQSVHRNSPGAVPWDRHCDVSVAVAAQNTCVGFCLVGGLFTMIYAAVFGLLAYFITEHDPVWGWVIFGLVFLVAGTLHLRAQDS